MEISQKIRDETRDDDLKIALPVNSTVMAKQRTSLLPARLTAVAVFWFIALPCLPSLGISHAQSYDKTPPPLGRLIDIGSRRLHLYCVGKGSPTVIIENGQSSFSIDWGLVQPEVAKVTRVCTYDRAGYAWSERGPATGSVEQTTDDLHLLLRVAGVRPPYILVGASIGSLYAQGYQRRYPSEVVGFVLDDPAGEEGAKYLVNGKDMPIYEMTGADMRTAFKPLFIKPPHYDPPTQVEEPYDRLPRKLQPLWLWARQKFFAEMDVINDLITADSWRSEFIALRRRRLVSPHPLGNLPLIVLGRNQDDNATRQKDLRTLTALSRAGKLIMVENSGHAIHLYQPAVVTRSINEVVDTARRKRRPQETNGIHSAARENEK
jgi:pimeloyl-ACP methyl ester carboxylesterase